MDIYFKLWGSVNAYLGLENFDSIKLSPGNLTNFGRCFI